MAAGDSQVYGAFVTGQMTGTNVVDFDTDNLRMILVQNTYTPDRDTHDFVDDVTAYELANGDGYTTNGVLLSSVAVTYDATNGWAKLTADNPSWTFSAPKTFAWAVLFKDTGVAATSPLIAWWELGNAARSGPFSLTVDTDGLVQFKATLTTA